MLTGRIFAICNDFGKIKASLVLKGGFGAVQTRNRMIYRKVYRSATLQLFDKLYFVLFKPFYFHYKIHCIFISRITVVSFMQFIVYSL